MAISDSATKKKSSPKKTKKPAAETKRVIEPVVAIEEIEDVVESSGIWVKVSESLQGKLKDLAEDEGLTLDEFISELLSEGVVVRAFDQWERRQHLRGGNSSMMSQQGNNGNGGGPSRRGGGRNRNNNRKNNHMRYQNLMEDSSSFLEYVRNQEKKGGR